MRRPIAIDNEISGTRGRYVGRIADVAGGAEITFTVPNLALIGADHIAARDDMRGPDAVLAPVEFLVADASRAGSEIIPVG